MKSRNTSIKSRSKPQTNTAFMMSLTVGSLAEFFIHNNYVTLSEYEQIMHQLKWVSKECRNIFADLSVYNSGEASDYHLTLESISDRLSSEIESLRLAITKAVMSNQSDLRSLGGKSYQLYKTTQDFYNITTEINLQ